MILLREIINFHSNAQFGSRTNMRLHSLSPFTLLHKSSSHTHTHTLYLYLPLLRQNDSLSLVRKYVILVDTQTL